MMPILYVNKDNCKESARLRPLLVARDTAVTSVKKELFSFCWFVCLSVNKITRTVSDECLRIFGRYMGQGIKTIIIRFRR